MRIALVTGGCRGIGLAITERLSKDGYQVVAVGRKSIEDVKAVLDAVEGVKPYYIQADVSVSERVGILEMTEESWDYVIDTNTKSNMFMTQLVANQMIKQEAIYRKRGTIVNISSCSSTVSSPNRAQYCVSKAGISMLTAVYADELAKYGIFVNEIRPGVIRSDMTSTVNDKYTKLIENGIFPIARWGEGEDVANAVAVFASDELLYTTGSHIDVDGGFHIQRL